MREGWFGLIDPDPLEFIEGNGGIDGQEGYVIAPGGGGGPGF